MMKRVFIFFLTWMSGFSLAHAQNESRKTLTSSVFMEMVKQYHPVVKQAGIGVQMADAALLSARGGFDPLLYLNTEQKTFDGKNYYQYTNPELKIPTWYGIEVKAGTENNGGQFLNSENTPGGSSYMGVSVPLAKNLLMDKRRAVLQQARIVQQLSRAEQLQMTNDLLYDGWKAYFDWQQSYRVYQIISRAVTVNEQRLQLVKSTWRLGDRPAIDTVEALSQLLGFRYQQNEALLNFKNAGAELANYLWSADANPVVPGDNVLPDTVTTIDTQPLPVLDDLLTNARTRHPKLQQFGYKLNWLEVERKLKFQNLLPTFNVQYNLLNKGYFVAKGLDAALLQNNYKFGITFGMPLRFSQGRGDYKQAKLKITEISLDRDLMRRAIETKVTQYYNEAVTLRNQAGVIANLLGTYRRLLQAEETRFKAGESSLFLINSRENKVLEGEQKLAELQVKYNKAIVAAFWAAGQLQ
jgi:outer membrane protein TolC